MKKNNFYFVFYLLSSLGLILSSCSKPPTPLPSWNYKEKAIFITYESKANLNAYDNLPHSLVLVIYQLDDPNNFKKLSSYKEGLLKILNNDLKDSNVLTSKKIFIEPKSKGKIILDRVKNSKWMAIIAGYYNLNPEKSSIFIKIPYKLEKKGFFSREKIAVIPDLKVSIILTADSIQQLKETNK